MGRKNATKIYVKNAYYHVYNRGVGKQKIFRSKQDFKVFLKYLKEYLSPPPKKEDVIKTVTLQDGVFKGVPRLPNNYFKDIELTAYCLIPNHFHLLLKQNDKQSMKEFLHSLSVRYSMYFNKKYDRVGPLFQGRYKAKLVRKENYLLHLSRYIHLNPAEYTDNLIDAYSSYAEYLGIRKTRWVKPKVILSFFENASADFKRVNTYKGFVEKYKKDSGKVLGDLRLE